MGDLEFRRIEVIQKYIVDEFVALRKWPACINLFVLNASARKRLLDQFRNYAEHAEVIKETLEEWLGEQGSGATFGKLIKLLRNEELNYLCDELLENLETIKNAQHNENLEVEKNVQIPCTNTANIENEDHIRNFCFGMTDVPNFVGRNEELETLHKLVTETREDGHSSLPLLTSVNGFGGIGKTTLARMYTWKYRNYFDGNVIWIHAEEIISMKTAFQNVAQKLNLDAAKSTHINLKNLTEDVYSAFEGSKCLFIFDNVEDFNGPNGIEQFLPTGSIGKPFLLLTSRKKDCFQTTGVFEMDVFSLQDSIELIKMHISGATDEICDKLANRLQRVPLAIHHAIAYITKSCPPNSLDSEIGAIKAVTSFLEEYERNSKDILKADFTDGDGYTKIIYSICKMCLRQMGREECGKIANHMLMYISFLNPGNIQLDFLLKLDYSFETVWSKLQRFIPRNSDSRRQTSDLSSTVYLLCSYSLIAVDSTNNKVTAHRVVQDAMRLMTPQRKTFYLQRILRSLAFYSKQTYGETLLHWVTVARHWNLQELQECTEQLLKEPTELGGFVIHAPWTSDTNIKLNLSFGQLVIPFINAMKCDKSVQNYLDIYHKITAARGGFRDKELNYFILTNYIVLANFIITEKHNRILRHVFECVSLLRMRHFRITFLIDLLGMGETTKDDISSFVEVLSSLGMVDHSTIKSYVFFEAGYHMLFNASSHITQSLLNEFPCLKYLKGSFTDGNNNNSSLDPKSASSWNYEQSIAWPLIQQLNFKILALRSAMAYIDYADCTIDEYIQVYKMEFETETEQGYKIPEIITQLINAKYLRQKYITEYLVLTLICCLKPTFNLQKIQFILASNDYVIRFNMILDSFQIITCQEQDMQLTDKYLQAALRKRVLSEAEKIWAVKALHKACLSSRNEGQFHDDLVNDWNYLIEQEDLGALAVNMGLTPFE